MRDDAPSERVRVSEHSEASVTGRRALAVVASGSERRRHPRRGHARHRVGSRAVAHRRAGARDPARSAVGRHLERCDRRAPRPRDRPHRQADRARRCVAASRLGGGIRLPWSLSLALSFLLSWAMGLAHLIALASAWSYNAGLKSTPISVLPFIVSFGLLPSLVTLSADPPSLAAAWAWVAGAALGVAVHLTNVLPDLEDDAQTGVRGLPHRLGRRASAVIAAAGARGRRRRGAARTGRGGITVVRGDRDLRGSRRASPRPDSCSRSCAHRGAGSSGS